MCYYIYIVVYRGRNISMSETPDEEVDFGSFDI